MVVCLIATVAFLAVFTTSLNSSKIAYGVTNGRHFAAIVCGKIIFGHNSKSATHWHTERIAVEGLTVPSSQERRCKHCRGRFGTVTLEIPLWPLTVAAGLIAAVHVGIIAAVILQGEMHAAMGKCRACGYDLTGNVSGRCPECGAPIDIDLRPG